ncbi:MAG: hypothetical protein HRU19_15655 [Pseudobacteriovorax sp.]|nr:hypothetical protein [Pseudobacteriovorax sp.]
MAICRKILMNSLLISYLITGCGEQNPNSQLDAVDIPNTSIKHQSIDNCWVYATVGWIESLHMRSGLGSQNFSETYLMYRYFQDQLVFTTPSRIETAGLWVRAKHIVKKFGLMYERDFIAEEADSRQSARQEEALDFVNNKLRDQSFRDQLVSLSGDQRVRFVQDMLDQAFAVQYREFSTKVIPADSIILKNSKGDNISLTKEIDRWHLEFHNRSLFAWDDAGLSVSDLPALPPSGLTQDQKDLQVKVIKALNRKDPVILEWFIDFNARDQRGVFSLESIIDKEPGRQGYHQTVIEDYVADIIDPVTGRVIKTVGEGQASRQDLKALEENGRLKYLIVKNSWGVDSVSYTVGGDKGFHRIDASYLFGWMKKTDVNRLVPADTGLRGFILPRG